MDFNSIGYYQLNNLIEVRVPMVLINLENVDLKPWYNSITAMHLDHISLHCTPEEAVAKVTSLGCPPHMSIVVLDQNESHSKKVADSLEKKGFINAYYVKGGFEGLSLEKSGSSADPQSSPKR